MEEIRERCLLKCSIETYEFEMMQKKSLKAGQSQKFKISKVLVAQEPMMLSTTSHSQVRIEEFVDELDELVKIGALERE